jgi:DNA polymerase/3'-5' exonuclease PolX
VKYEDALPIAEALVAEMRPYCERIEIAGSLRRRKAEVRDIELVAIPRWELRRVPGGNHLYGWALRYSTSAIRWIKPGVPETVDWPLKPDGRYWHGLLPSGMKLDLFLATRENWGVIFLIRTGSAEFSQAVATHGKRIGLRFTGGYLVGDGVKFITYEEADVFQAMGLAWIEPEERTGASDVSAHAVGHRR